MTLFLDSFLSAVDSLWKQKKRTLATMLGFTVGIAMVVVVLSVGTFCSEVIKLYYAGIANGKYLSVSACQMNDRTVPRTIMHKDCLQFNADPPEYVYGVIFESSEQFPAEIYCGEKKSSAMTYGISAASQEQYQIQMKSGRFITEADCNGTRSSVVISDKTAYAFFGDIDAALHSELKLRLKSGETLNCYVTGIYKTNKTDENEKVRPVYLPYTTLDRLTGSKQPDAYPELKVSYQYGTISETMAIQNTYEYFSAVYPDLFIMVQIPEAPSADSIRMVRMLTLMFVFFSALTFLVSGIGLTNTLLISVTERTSEIGIRKALGAPNRSIRWQFMTEALIVCLLSCFGGILLGFAADFCLKQNIETMLSKLLDEKYSYIIAHAALPLKPSLSGLIIVLVISLLLGRIFGGYPARKAVRMQPIEALRYE